MNPAICHPVQRRPGRCRTRQHRPAARPGQRLRRPPRADRQRPGRSPGRPRRSTATGARCRWHRRHRARRHAAGAGSEARRGAARRREGCRRRRRRRRHRRRQRDGRRQDTGGAARAAGHAVGPACQGTDPQPRPAHRDGADHRRHRIGGNAQRHLPGPRGRAQGGHREPAAHARRRDPRPPAHAHPATRDHRLHRHGRADARDRVLLLEEGQPLQRPVRARSHPPDRPQHPPRLQRRQRRRRAQRHAAGCVLRRRVHRHVEHDGSPRARLPAGRQVPHSARAVERDAAAVRHGVQPGRIRASFPGDGARDGDPDRRPRRASSRRADDRRALRTQCRPRHRFQPA